MLRGDTLARAIAVLRRDQHRWHCGHHFFIAGSLGPWARAHRGGRELVGAMSRLACYCSERLHEVIEDRLSGLQPATDTDMEERPTLEERVAGLLRKRESAARFHGRPATELPGGLDAVGTLFHFVWHDPWVEWSALRAALEHVGCCFAPPVCVLHHLVSRLSHGADRPLEDAFAGELERIARHHPDGRYRVLVRQALGEIASDDLISMLAFEAAGDAGSLDRLPTRGAPDRDLAREIFRQALSIPTRSAGMVGAALLRDAVARPAALERLARGGFDNVAEEGCATGCWTLLASPPSYSSLRRFALHPYRRPLWSHYAEIDEDNGQRVSIRGPAPLPLVFPYFADDVREVLMHLQIPELERSLGQESVREARMEAAIELGWRGAARRVKRQTLKDLLQRSPSFDEVRLAHALVVGDPTLALPFGRTLLDHPSWEVRVIAAGAILAHRGRAGDRP